MIAAIQLTARHEEFLLEWFGHWGRELGVPERFYTEDPQALFRLIEDGKRLLHPVYMSVQPFSGRDQACALEKLFFDFDCLEDALKAWKEASVFAQTLKRFYSAEPLITYSGHKGYHVYAFLSNVVTFEAGQIELARQVYAKLQHYLLKGQSFVTLDQNVIGDIKRLARVPFSVHEKTGSLCCPVTLDRAPFTPENLDAYRTLDAYLLEPVIKQMQAEEKLKALQVNPHKSKTIGKIRPCIQAALEKPLEGQGGHLMRLAIAREYLAIGYGVDEIVALFKKQPDFNERKTNYYVEHAHKNPAKPFKCQTIRNLGFCIPDCRRQRKVA